MKKLAYSIISALALTIVYLTTLMVSHPYTNRNMYQAYYYGCNFGARPLTEPKVRECEDVARLFEETLEDFDKQMENR